MSTDPAEPAIEDHADALQPQSAAARAAAEALTEQHEFEEPAAATVYTPPPPVGQPLPAATGAAASEQRPQVLIGGAFMGGLVLAKLLGRRRGR